MCIVGVCVGGGGGMGCLHSEVRPWAYMRGKTINLHIDLLLEMYATPKPKVTNTGQLLGVKSQNCSQCRTCRK